MKKLVLGTAAIAAVLTLSAYKLEGCGGSDPITIAFAGDVAGNSNTCNLSSGNCQGATATLIAGYNPDYVFGLGDYQYDIGTMTQFLSNYDQSWGQFKPKMYLVNGGSHDCYGSDGGSGCSSDPGYLSYFNSTTPGGGPTPRTNQIADNYYKRIGGWGFYFMDSYCWESHTEAPCTPATWTAWLTAQLAQDTADGIACSMLMFHEPFYTSQGGSSVHPPDKTTQDWVDAFYAAGGDALMTAHNHFYERFDPMDSHGNLGGMTTFVVGTGGRSHYVATTPAAHRAAYNDATFGALFVSLAVDHMDYQFKPVAGQSFTDPVGGGTTRIDCR